MDTGVHDETGLAGNAGQEEAIGVRRPLQPIAGRVLALSTFLGAFLLFFVEPLMGRFILPWFGGSAGVWTTCLLFFQVCLLAGYAYADALARRLPVRVQVILHVALLAIALAFLPVIPGAQWKPEPETEPVRHILGLLTVCLGVPFLVLSSTGPLMQAWFNRLNPGASPYRLYALSNAGSLTALLSYPFVFEPLLSRRTQALFWSGGFVAFTVCAAVAARALWRGGQCSPRASVGESTSEAPVARITLGERCMWLVLPGCAVVLLLATTNKLCQDVAVLPFMWVAPLALYLLSFIICFERPNAYRRPVWHGALLLAAPFVLYALFRTETLPWPIQAAIHCVGLFVACMVCHGELHRRRPAPKRVTSYYLHLALGGALGGIFVGLAAPRLFASHLELNLGWILLGLLVALVQYTDRFTVRIPTRRIAIWPASLAGALALAIGFIAEARKSGGGAIAAYRSFYGVLRILESDKGHPIEHAFSLKSGATLHGLQYVHPIMAARTTTYYHEHTGIGLAFRSLPPADHRRIGVVGLGVGTLAAYARAGDVIRFYEINPQVIELARTRFTYLSRTKAQAEVVLGDARLSLEREPAQAYDVLVLDAFTSDAIPVHLLTREAFETYLRHLAPGGVLAIHISSRHLALEPVLAAVAQHFDLPHARLEFRASANAARYPADWVLLTRNPALLDQTSLGFVQPRAEAPSRSRLWTDEFVSVFKLMKRPRPSVPQQPPPALPQINRQTPHP